MSHERPEWLNNMLADAADNGRGATHNWAVRAVADHAMKYGPVPVLTREDTDRLVDFMNEGSQALAR